MKPPVHRIGLVCPYSFDAPGGVQNHVLGLAGWLSGQGHRVAVLGPGAPDDRALGAAGLVRGQFTSTGGAVPVHWNGSVARISFNPLVASRVRTWLARTQPEVVHVHEPIIPSVSLLALWNATSPVVATFHAATPRSFALAGAGRVLARSIRRIDTAIAVSDVAREVVHDHLGLSAQVIGNGIGLPPRPLDLDKPGHRGMRPRIVFVGRYDEPRKGFEVFSAALPRIRAEFPQVQVDVIGAGRPRSVDGVRFLGRLDDEQRDAALSSADVYVAPHTGRESFGIVLLEALACGAEVVASDLPAFRAVLTTGAGELLGRTFPVGDPAALADQVIEALRQPSPQRRLRGWTHAASFAWPQIGRRIAQVYDRVLGVTGWPGDTGATGRGVAR